MLSDSNVKNIALNIKSELQQQNKDLEFDGQQGVFLEAKEEDAFYLKNVKDDIVLIQFKLIRKESMKTVNTISFLNVPMAKINDTNL